jgi:hypothetical protein
MAMATAGGHNLVLEQCAPAVRSQQFVTRPIPANMKAPAGNAMQLFYAKFDQAGCLKTDWTSGNQTNCAINVEAWGTAVGDKVWVDGIAETEPGMWRWCPTVAMLPHFFVCRFVTKCPRRSFVNC